MKCDSIGCIDKAVFKHDYIELYVCDLHEKTSGMFLFHRIIDDDKDNEDN